METNVKQAGFLKRLLAYMIDYFVLNFGVGFIIILIFVPLGFYLGMSGYDEDTVVFIAYLISVPISFFIITLYYAIMESSKLQGTVGKVALKLKVVDKHGQRITFWRAFARAFCMMFSFFILGIGWLMILWTKDKQSLHDKMSGCFVILDEKSGNLKTEADV